MTIISASRCSKCKKIKHEIDLVRDIKTDKLICKDSIVCAATIKNKATVIN